MGTPKRMREVSKIVAEIAPNHEVYVTNRCHIAVCLTVGERSRTVFTALTPSDEYRSLIAFRANVRRTVREMQSLDARP